MRMSTTVVHRLNAIVVLLGVLLVLLFAVLLSQVVILQSIGGGAVATWSSMVFTAILIVPLSGLGVWLLRKMVEPWLQGPNIPR